MKRILVALTVGALFGSLLTGLASLSSAIASGPVAQEAALAQNTAPAPPEAIPAPAPIVDATTVNERISPAAEDVDPVLGTRKWGTRSSGVRGARGDAITADLHVDVEDYENNLLAEQQSSELLEIFEDSRGVRRLIERYDGDPCSSFTTYYVKEIDANEDEARNSTPWVTATLRADFASPEGKRAIEMRVYRRKTHKGRLDNTPYVASTQVAYVDSEGDLSTHPGYHPPKDDRAGSPDGLQTIRFKN